MDLKHPKLDWTNETQPIKNNLTVFLDMLAAMFAPAILGGLYFLLFRLISPIVYLVILVALFAGLALPATRWLAGKGREIFRSL